MSRKHSGIDESPGQALLYNRIKVPVPVIESRSLNMTGSRPTNS